MRARAHYIRVCAQDINYYYFYHHLFIYLDMPSPHDFV